MKLTEYHYVYYSYEEYDRGYIGSRTCKCLPEEDINYFGSFKDKTFKPTQKIILKSDYATREEAYVDEIILQEYYKVVENPHFANRAYQTSTGFSRKGIVPWNKGVPRDPEIIKKMNNARKNKPPHNKGKKMSLEQRQKLSLACKGRKVLEETKEKISKSIKGKILTEDHKRRISEANTGTSKTMTEKRKQSDIEKGLRARGKSKPKHSEETKRKISEIAQGRVPWNKGIKDLNITGGKHPRAKRIMYNNIVYDCIKTAVIETKKTRYHIQKYGTLLANS
jgi:hypothetical protein